jgi:ABC-type lipoprotein release transport system permease subunit
VAQIRQLRIVATLLFAFAIAQAGLGSGYLDGPHALIVAHATNAFAVLVLAVIGAVAGLVPAWRAIQTRIPDALQYE